MTTESKPTPYKIVASDLDGTLLAPNHQLSSQTKRTLKTLHDKGFTFVFATGRHHVDVAGIREIAGIPAYMITANGARVHNQQDELMFSKDVPEELVQEIVDVLKDDPTIFVHIYRHNEWYLSGEDTESAKYHNQSGFTFTSFNTNQAPKDGVAKVFFTSRFQDHEHLAEYETKLRERFQDKLSIAFSSPWCLEVMGPDVSKGDALKAVAESMGLSLENCIAFGDGMNDQEMLTMAGKGLVMGTAHPKVLQVLPTIERIGSSADDAVAHYLENNLL
ncbi:Cof-type HAD-IIB family hydrolase [Vibrio tritonius]|uniref:Cof-type HAD-IIB family hydrolase n=1 Tax=Vibrio tritonius TaxID=1435069 RepID=UPI0008387CC9|nr:Cof-type HAD-IIB family hydrolase [Vibrio tritonius]